MRLTYLRFETSYPLPWLILFAENALRHLQTDVQSAETLYLPLEADGMFSDAPPGVTELVSGFLQVYQSMTLEVDSTERANHLMIALDRFIVSEVVYYWSAVYAEEYRLRDWFWTTEAYIRNEKMRSGEVESRKLERAISFLKQPESNAYRSSRLLNLIDQIELELADRSQND